MRMASHGTYYDSVMQRDVRDVCCRAAWLNDCVCKQYMRMYRSDIRITNMYYVHMCTLEGPTFRSAQVRAYDDRA